MNSRYGAGNTLAALERNQELLKGRVGLIGLPAPDLPVGLDNGAGLPLVISEHAGTTLALEQTGCCSVHFGYSRIPADQLPVDTVVVFVPKAREALSMHLSLASSLLSEDGRVVLVGEKREGIAGAARRLQELAPEARKVDSARHCQVWVARLPLGNAHFEPQQWLNWHTVDHAGTRIKAAGMPGIFSDGRLDQGTAHLLQSLADTPVSGPVLDFACGAGIIGAWLQARFKDLGPIDGVDVQAQAVFCARQTYDRNQVVGEITAHDGLPEGLEQYQSIVTNPPFHSGVRTDTSMTERFLQQARRHLRPGGELRLVANRFLPYRDLLEEHVGPCRILYEDRRFVVYQAKAAS